MEDFMTKNTSVSSFLLITYGILLFIFNIIIFRLIATYGWF